MWQCLVDWWTEIPNPTKMYLGFVIWGVFTVMMIRGLQFWAARIEDGDRVSVDPDD